MTRGMPWRSTHYLWLARALIALVVFINIQCSVAFLMTPDLYVHSFDLQEPSGIFMIQGLGLLFLMWNVPYLFALWHPKNHVVSLIESVIMQAVGFIGESILLSQVPAQYPALRSSVIRFIIFDGSGLVLLLLAFLIIRIRSCSSKH